MLGRALATDHSFALRSRRQPPHIRA